jgi:hypothetical protein
VPKPEVSITRPRFAQPSEAELSPTRASKANVYVIRLLAVLCLCDDCTFSRLRFGAAEFWTTRRNRTRPDTSPPQRTPHGVAEVGARRSPWFPMNGGSKCPLKNQDALLSFSQRWRSALSPLLPLLHLRLAQCMPSRWFGRSREFTSWGARPRFARRGRNPKATSMIHSHPCYWDEDASPRVLLCPARPQKADVRRGARPQR